MNPTMLISIAAAVLAAIFITALIVIRRLKDQLSIRDTRIADLRHQHQTEIERINAEGQARMTETQTLVDQQLAEMKGEIERARQHYESEARGVRLDANAMVAKLLKDLEPLQKYQRFREPELEAQRLLSQAMTEAAGMREEAAKLVEKARLFASEEHSRAMEKAKAISQQADALLSQATRDAGRIVADAEKRAEQIGGDAYVALRDKELLEQAAKALRNVIEGYGDRYVIPTRSLLDDLADDYGHTAAGEALRAAREQSRRMVEQGLAAQCDYVEASRKDTAIRFVIDAFNGRADAILSRVKHDNVGTLEEEMRDAFSLVNLNGQAFRDARILSTYFDARLAELKWAVVLQELKLKEREEQRRIKEQIREEEKARREYERAIQQAAREEELIRKAMETAERQIQQGNAEQKEKYEQQLQELSQKLKEAEDRNRRAVSMAQQTKRGHVYIISNIGSFGEHVYKIGLTRRLEPMDRIDELGDSSVPFDFDVHAFIFSDDAPALEAQLHNHFVLRQINKIDHRKEFFRVDLQHVREEIEKLGFTPNWTMTAQAAEYRESLVIERKIKDNPTLREAWINRQFELEMEDLKEAVAPTPAERASDTAIEVERA
jgi:Domain of unknown function (DUF4041)/Meiotically up-regulated gene 113